MVSTPKLENGNQRHGTRPKEMEEQLSNVVNVEEGELSARDDPSWVHPKKRKAGSPVENGKQ